MSDRSDISVAKVLASFATVFLFSVHTNYAGEFDIVVKDCAIEQRCVTDQDPRNIAVGMLLSYEQRESGICGIE